MPDWHSETANRERVRDRLFWVFIVSCYIFAAVIFGWLIVSNEARRNAFLSSCKQDHKTYECMAMWSTNWVPPVNAPCGTGKC